MALIKCKMCGGQLNIEPDSSVCECEYCGSKQTIPNTDDEKRLKLYERANRLRFDCEFDKAFGVYESIVSEFQEEAEAYWGLVLCKYGIEYVDDPASGKKIPTCHRSSFDSVMDDPNFDLVMENADSVARGIYRDEAKQIEEIRKGIIEVSSTEEPYDIFICYKETADNGDRTIDSVIAQDVYKELTAEGYRVFFSRITLEDKLGQEYEPYIFAALNSAKVMLAFGTSYEYYNAVWVKNEWSRFLKLIAEGQKKTLIPCYKDIDAYDMPKEFKHLQAQDMGKVGAVQDLIRGIEKLIGKKGTVKPAQPISGGDVYTSDVLDAKNAAQLKRGFIALEDGEWENAKAFFEEVLNYNAECAEAYLGEFLANESVKSINEYKTIKISKIKNIVEDIKKNNKGECITACEVETGLIDSVISEYSVTMHPLLSPNKIYSDFKYDRSYISFSKVVTTLANNYREELENDKLLKRVRQYGDSQILEELNETLDSILQTYDSYADIEKENDKQNEERIKSDYHIFINKVKEDVIGRYKTWDDSKPQEYEKLKDETRQIIDDNKYSTSKPKEYYAGESEIKQVINSIKLLGEYQDCIELIHNLETELDYRKGIMLFTKYKAQYDQKGSIGRYIPLYNTLDKLRKNQNVFKALDDYKDSKNYAEKWLKMIEDIETKESKYKAAIDFFNDESIIYDKFRKQYSKFEMIRGYRDSESYLTFIKNEQEKKYQQAKELLEKKNYGAAAKELKEIDGYRDSSSLYKKSEAKDKASLLGCAIFVFIVIIIIIFFVVGG